MAKNRQPLVYQEDHTYYCILQDEEGNKFIGKATCCEEDYEFESEKVGYTIAHIRACIKLAKSTIKTIKHKEQALSQLYHCMRKSKHFNPKSYEAKMLFRQIRLQQDDIQAIKEVIEDLRDNLKSFLEDKEKFYKSIKKVREDKKAEDKQ